ncbi:MAG: hypothetical protein ACPG3V_01670 [Porticoccaceae bacterium]
MKLLTRFELATMKTPEMQVLYRQYFNHLANPHLTDIERSNALGTMQNITNELASRIP